MKRKPRVLIDTFHLRTATTGIRTYTTELCKGIEEVGSQDFDYFIFPNWRKADSSTFLKGKLPFFKKILTHISFMIWKQVVIPIYLLINRIDHAFYPDYVAPALPMFSRSWITFHDTFFWDFKENYPKIWQLYFLPMVWAGRKKNSVVVATSLYTKERLLERLKLENTIEILYQAPKIHQDQSKDADILKQYDLESSNYILHVGVFDRRKNLHVLVDGFKIWAEKNPEMNTRLVLVGGRGISYKQDCFQEILDKTHQHGLGMRIIQTGYLTHAELEAVYSKAFGYIFPSLDEGFGIPVLEAFHYKLPLIISDRGSLQEIAADAALVFKAKDPEDLAMKLESIHKEDIRQNLISKGQKRLVDFGRRKFALDFESMILKYEDTAGS